MRPQFRAGAAGDTKGVGYEVVDVLALWALIIIDFADHLGCMFHCGTVTVRRAPVSLLLAIEADEVCTATLVRPGVVNPVWMRNCVAASVCRSFKPPWGVVVVSTQYLEHLLLLLGSELIGRGAVAAWGGVAAAASGGSCSWVALRVARGRVLATAA